MPVEEVKLRGLRENRSLDDDAHWGNRGIPGPILQPGEPLGAAGDGLARLHEHMAGYFGGRTGRASRGADDHSFVPGKPWTLAESLVSHPAAGHDRGSGRALDRFSHRHPRHDPPVADSHYRLLRAADHYFDDGVRWCSSSQQEKRGIIATL